MAACALALRGRALPHLVPSACMPVQRTYLQRVQAKVCTSWAVAGNILEGKVSMAFSQLGLRHLGSRHLVRVVHLGRNMHGGCEQSWHLSFAFCLRGALTQKLKKHLRVSSACRCRTTVPSSLVCNARKRSSAHLGRSPAMLWRAKFLWPCCSSGRGMWGRDTGCMSHN